MKKLIPMAICYDFDGTLAFGNMQEHGFVNKLQMTPSEFWQMSNNYAKEQNADPILAYMKMMRDCAFEKGLPFTRKEFQEYGATVPLFPGVDTWFKRINAYAASKGVRLEHYIISSGLKEMIEGTEIAPYFKQIYASTFMYDDKGEAVWPAVALNYTAKTQFLFRINKGCHDINDNETINMSMPEEDKPVPFSHFVYVGDGDTDVPCMKMVKLLGGHTVAVYQPKKAGASQKAKRLVKEKRADMAVPADYSDGTQMDIFIRAIVDKIATSARVVRLIKRKKKKIVSG